MRANQHSQPLSGKAKRMQALQLACTKPPEVSDSTEICVPSRHGAHAQRLRYLFKTVRVDLSICTHINFTADDLEFPRKLRGHARFADAVELKF